jgi:hypothetical protein
MWKQLKQWWLRDRRPKVTSYLWVPSPAWQELPPLANDPRFVTRVCRHNISEYRVPRNVRS